MMNKEEMELSLARMMEALDEKNIESLRATYYSEITGKTLEVNEYDLSDYDSNDDEWRGILL